jgi:hypothetical protein
VSVLLKGALVSFAPTFVPIPIPDVIVFQYNPESMTHTWTQPEAASSAGTEGSNPLAVAGMPGESFSFTLAMDASDEIADGLPPTAAIAQATGLYSRIAALEMLLYPSGTTNKLVGAVTAAVGSLLGGSSPKPKRIVPQSVMPVTLFIWGPGRIVPVRMTALTITEKLYDPLLNPTHVDAQITLRVLTPAELTAASADGDVLGKLASVAYGYTLTLRQTLAVANLGNAAESIIGMIPH